MTGQHSRHDEVVLRLQDLRRAAGEPSYARIAQQVAQLRVARGVAVDAAMPPRSTVYDAFKLGRRRLDPELVADLVAVLEAAADRAPVVGSVPAVADLPARSEAPGEPGLGASAEPGPALAPEASAAPATDAFAAAAPEADDSSPSPSPSGPSPSGPSPSGPAVDASATSTSERGPTPEPELGAATVESPAGSAPDAVAQPSMVARGLLLAFCLVINLVGLIVIDGMDIPIWLDMIGTAIAAIALGPWWGVGVGLGSSALDGWLTGEIGFWFAPVTAVGALVWGYGARWCAMATTPLRFFLLNVAVAVASTAVAAPITYLRFDGFTQHGSDNATLLLVEHLPSLAVAVLIANLVYSLLDKLISGFIALAVLESLGPRWGEVRRLLRRSDS